jgi:hypothetical protein
MNTSWTISSPLRTYLTTCTQEVSTVVGVSDKIVKECHGALKIGHQN